MIPDFIPAKVFMVYLSGAGLVLGAFSVILNKMARMGSLMLAIELIIIAAILFLPGAIDGDQNAISMFLKDLGLAGALYYVSLNSDN